MWKTLPLSLCESFNNNDDDDDNNNVEFVGGTASHDAAACAAAGDGSICSYTAMVDAADEGCVAIDEALCAGADLAGSDSASQAQCEAISGGSKCSYTARAVAELGLHWQSRQPTTSLDRACDTLTVCAAGEWEATPPMPSSDRECSPITECLEFEVEQAAPTATSDRVCEPMSPSAPEPEPPEEATRTQFENRCVMSQFLPPLATPMSVISGCMTSRSRAGGCNVPNLMQSMYTIAQLIGISSVQACGSLCFADPGCIGFLFGRSQYNNDECTKLRAVPPFYKLALVNKDGNTQFGEFCEPDLYDFNLVRSSAIHCCNHV
jgi:hypothetical protein